MNKASSSWVLFDHRPSHVVDDRSVRIRSLVEANAPAEQVLTIINEHQLVVDALRQRNAPLAHERLVVHLQAGMERALAALTEMA